MNKFSQQLQNRLNDISAVKELLSRPSTQRLRKDYRLSFRQQWQHPEIRTFYWAACGMFGVFSAAFMLTYGIQSPVIWGLWAAILGGCGLWSLKFGRWVLDAGYEWHEKAKSLGLRHYHLNTEFEEASFTLKAKVVERCEQLGASPTQVQQLYAIAKDCDLPKQWWGELNYFTEKYTENEMYREQEKMENLREAGREMLARLKMNA